MNDSRPNPLEEDVSSKGSVILGLIGALAGALIGAIPWFLLSTFTGYFVGWLGFLIGWLSCVLYCKFRGYKSTALATVIIILASIIALIAAIFGSYMYSLCTDPEWKRDAARYGIPVARLAFDSLLMKENLPQILPSMAIGLIIGLVGVISARGTLLEYTDPKEAEKREKLLQQRNAKAYYPDNPEEIVIPPQFTLREPKSSIVSGAICSVVFLAFFVLNLIYNGNDGVAAWGFAHVVFGAFLLLGLYLLIRGIVSRIEVDRDRIIHTGTFGNKTEFTLRHIGSVYIPKASNGTIKLFYPDGKKILAKFSRNMKNSELMLQYLAKNNIPVRDKK